ncbi:hypothetical protein [Altererythrobacter sp. B11]|uniref:hypothetical protein n=1 Tax=Altererythrobacter sp. B11 TaxID=2060312 RepID=UPI001558C4DF|nr:hypothetical protein [Altererythrobacter sp. B11]
MSDQPIAQQMSIVLTVTGTDGKQMLDFMAWWEHFRIARDKVQQCRTHQFRRLKGT